MIEFEKQEQYKFIDLRNNKILIKKCGKLQSVKRKKYIVIIIMS